MKRTYHVGHLPRGATEDMVRPAFKPYGNVLFVRIPPNKLGEPQTFAFVDIEHSDKIQIGQLLKAKITIKDRPAIVSEYLPIALDGPEHVAKAKKVHVSNLPPTATEKNLKDAFVPFGTIEDVAIVRCRHTGASRGFGFVTFSKCKSCRSACSTPVKVIGTLVKCAPKLGHRAPNFEKELSREGKLKQWQEHRTGEAPKTKEQALKEHYDKRRAKRQSMKKWLGGLEGKPPASKTARPPAPGAPSEPGAPKPKKQKREAEGTDSAAAERPKKKRRDTAAAAAAAEEE